MKKIGTAEGLILVGLKTGEFSDLWGAPASNVPDGTTTTLTAIRNALDLMKTSKSSLTEVKKTAQTLIDQITSVGI